MYGSSVCSERSFGSSSTIPGRRKPKLRWEPRKESPKGTPEAKPYQCTFCMAVFPSAPSWKRHESTIHLLDQVWICSPSGATNPGGLCVFCHRHSAYCTDSCGRGCSDKPPETRSFSRSDHLKQHMDRIHNSSPDPHNHGCQQMELPYSSRCGFCEKEFSQWDKRIDHIQNHFREGEVMDNWHGDWGLPPEWNKRVLAEGAILPSNRQQYPSSQRKRPANSDSGETLRKKPRPMQKRKTRICSNCQEKKVRFQVPKGRYL